MFNVIKKRASYLSGGKKHGISPGDETDAKAGDEKPFRSGGTDYTKAGGGATKFSTSGGAVGGQTEGAPPAGTKEGGIGGGFSSFTSSGGQLSDAELASHHRALANHYDSIVGNKPPQTTGGLAHDEAADLAGDESIFDSYSDQQPGGEGAVPESFETGKAMEPSLAIDGEDLEDLTGLQEPASEEKTETDQEQADEDTGNLRGAGGGLRNSKNQKPLSAFDQTRKSVGFGNKYKGKKGDKGY